MNIDGQMGFPLCPSRIQTDEYNLLSFISISFHQFSFSYKQKKKKNKKKQTYSIYV